MELLTIQDFAREFKHTVHRGEKTSIWDEFLAAADVPLSAEAKEAAGIPADTVAYVPVFIPLGDGMTTVSKGKNKGRPQPVAVAEYNSLRQYKAKRLGERHKEYDLESSVVGIGSGAEVEDWAPEVLIVGMDEVLKKSGSLTWAERLAQRGDGFKVGRNTEDHTTDKGRLIKAGEGVALAMLQRKPHKVEDTATEDAVKAGEGEI